jgi:hypothetical protein
VPERFTLALELGLAFRHSLFPPRQRGLSTRQLGGSLSEFGLLHRAALGVACLTPAATFAFPERTAAETNGPRLGVRARA